MSETEGKREQLSVPTKPELRRAIERATQAWGAWRSSSRPGTA